MTQTKVWDITQPVDDWGKSFAHIEYLRLDIPQTKKITVLEPEDIPPYTCMDCGKLNNYFKYNCAECEARGEAQEGLDNDN